ncbi:MAG: substrate-binding domain-containing protein [Firmicutes bacterium]|nr:substrate-binding domain-containing protein [Bacillota bacterium]
MKKLLTVLCAFTAAALLFVGCSSEQSASFDGNSSITVISRENGSGTRGAFIELFGVEQKDADGNKVDMTSPEAQQTNSTSVVLTSVAGNAYAIGYISLGSLNDTVKALKIDGAEATVENIKNGSYKAARPFNIVYKDGLSETAQDFVNFIMSKEGQEVIEGAGYISAAAGEAFSCANPSGRIVIGGSSSVTPVMGKLKEAYEKINANVTIEIQETDSTSGINGAIDGVCDIGMASRELKDSEAEKGLSSTKIAIDGIAVIVNKQNTTDGLTTEQVGKIFMGGITKWNLS